MRAGDIVSFNDKLLRLDDEPIKFEIGRLESRIRLNKIKAAKLEDIYIDRFVIDPMNELLKKYENQKNDCLDAEEIIRANVRQGLAYPSTLDQFSATARESEARFVMQENEIHKKKLEIMRERAQSKAEEKELSDELRARKDLLIRHIIMSPRRDKSKVDFCVPAGTFVEEGDVIVKFEG